MQSIKYEFRRATYEELLPCVVDQEREMFEKWAQEKPHIFFSLIRNHKVVGRATLVPIQKAYWSLPCGLRDMRIDEILTNSEYVLVEKIKTEGTLIDGKNLILHVIGHIASKYKYVIGYPESKQGVHMFQFFDQKIESWNGWNRTTIEAIKLFEILKHKFKYE